MSKQKIFISSVLVLATFLRLYKLQELMPFIGDQGWFYISARDLIISNQIPLVGITASYTWLHQGALWTYMLAPVLWLFNFSPLSGGYLSVVIGVSSVIVMFKVAKTLFSEKVAIISTILFATSPLVIFSSRMPYHTSPISLLVLFFIYSIYRYSKGSVKYLIVASFLLGLLYNFELATMVFWPMFFLVMYFTKKPKLNILLKSLLAFLIPLIPMIIYDLGNGKLFQTTAFIRIIKLSFFSESALTKKPITNVFKEIVDANNQLVFTGNGTLSVLIVLFSIFCALFFLIKARNKKSNNMSLIILVIVIFFPLFGIVATRTVSGAYLPMLFPGVILIVSYAIYRLMKMELSYKLVALFVLVVICLSSIKFILIDEYASNNQIKFTDRTKVAKEIVKSADGRKYNLVGKGEGSQFSSFTNNYEYLAWWLGNGPSNKNEKLIYTIEESGSRIILSKWQKE